MYMLLKRHVYINATMHKQKQHAVILSLYCFIFVSLIRHCGRIHVGNMKTVIKVDEVAF